MGSLYAGSEVLQMAVEIERKGKAFYDGVVQAMGNEKVKSIFQYLSDEEVKHEKTFKQMLNKLETNPPESPYDDMEMIIYFRSLIDRKIFPSENEGSDMKNVLADPKAAIRIALSLEKDAVLFFNEMLQITNEKDHSVVQAIIEEEREHIKRILKLKDELKV